MFIAMNRFKVKLGEEKYFEEIWKNRDSHLKEVPGFKKFNLVRGGLRMIILFMLRIALGIQKKVL